MWKMPSTVRRPCALTRLTRLHAVSTAADAGIAVALAGSLFFNVSTDVARPRLALYLLLTIAPVAIMTPLLGPALARIGGRRGGLLAVTGAGRAILAVLLVTNIQTALLYPESFAILVLGRAYSAVKRALVPAFVTDERDLVAANARLSRVGTLSGVTGGVLATGILQVAGTSGVLLAAAVGHGVATLLATRLHAPVVSRAPANLLIGRATPRPSTQRGPVVAMAALRAAVGLVVFVLAFALEREGGPDPLLGVVALAIAVGSFAGTFVSPRLRAVTNEHTMLRAGTVVGAVTALVAAVAADMRTVVLATFVLALASSVGRHACDSVLQRAAGTGDRSRVFAALRYRAAAGVGCGRARPDGRRRRYPVRLRHRHMPSRGRCARDRMAARHRAPPDRADTTAGTAFDRRRGLTDALRLSSPGNDIHPRDMAQAGCEGDAYRLTLADPGARVAQRADLVARPVVDGDVAHGFPPAVAVAVGPVVPRNADDVALERLGPPEIRHRARRGSRRAGGPGTRGSPAARRTRRSRRRTATGPGRSPPR